MARRTFEIQLEPRVLRWARDRAGLSDDDLAEKLRTGRDRVAAWELTGRLRLVQAERLARATHTPLGLLYLDAPPNEVLPFADFRTTATDQPRRPSPNLLDVVDDAQRRQDWYRDYLVSRGAEPLDIVGALDRATPVVEAAELLRNRHRFDAELRARAGTWEEALRYEIEHVEDADVLVMRSGIVGNNTHRPLDVDEFRGFAIADPYAPLIFLNARDALAAQMFSLMHELVHLWLGQSGVSNLELTRQPDNEVELYCSAVAAEILVPERTLRDDWAELAGNPNPRQVLLRRYKVSSLVLLRRLFDIGVLDWETFRSEYQLEETRFREIAATRPRGGSFYNTEQTRSSKRFAAALVESTLEGQTPWRDAMRLLGIRKAGTLNEMARRMGFVV